VGLTDAGSKNLVQVSTRPVSRVGYGAVAAENQINIRVIQALARHRHLNTTMRYIDVNDVKLQNAVEVVGM